MDAKNNSKAISPRNQKQVNPLNEGVISKTYKFATNEKKELDQTSATVDQWGFFRRFWDSKVPEKDKSFFNSISFKLSDKKKVVDEIKKYQDFYEKFGNITKSVKETLDSEDERSVNLHKMVLQMNQKLLEMREAAEFGSEATNSSTMHKLHEQFKKKHEEIEYMIQGIQCIALKEDLNNATASYKESIERTKRIEADFEEKEREYQERYRVTAENVAKAEESNRNMKYKVDKMAEAFVEMKERHDTLLAENRNIEETNKELKADVEKVKTECGEIKQAIKDVTLQNSQLLTALHTMIEKINKD